MSFLLEPDAVAVRFVIHITFYDWVILVVVSASLFLPLTIVQTLVSAPVQTSNIDDS